MCRPSCGPVDVTKYDHSGHCYFDLWAPEGYVGRWNRAFSAYAGSFELAARELAAHPEAQDDADLQDAICRKYGIFLDNITDDEAKELSRMVERLT